MIILRPAQQEGKVTIECGDESISFKFILPPRNNDLDRLMQCLRHDFLSIAVQLFKSMGYVSEKEKRATFLLIRAKGQGAGREHDDLIDEAMKLLDLG